MSFTADVSRRDGGRSSRARRRRDRDGRDGPRRGARRRRPAVHPRRRRLGRPRQPRRQRLPQDLRLRGLRADRQRLRADRAHQRRGLGHHLLGVARRARASARDDALLVFSVGGGNAEQEHLGEPRRAPSSWRRSAAPRSSASSAATAASPPRSPTACVVDPAAVPGPHHAAHRGPVRRRLAPARQPPGAASDRDQVGVAARDRAALGRVFIVGGAGFIGSHFVDRLLAATRHRARHASTTTSPRAASGTSRRMRDDARLEVVRGDVEDLRRPGRRGRGHDTVIHLASNPDIARAATEPDIDFGEGTVLTNHVVEAIARAGVPHDPLRLGQRRLRRPRRARGRRGPRPAGAGLDLRREQARRRGADLRPTPTCSARRLRLPLRQRRRPAPDARRRLRLRPPAARRPDPAAHPRRRHAEQVVHPRRRRGRRRAARRRAGRRARSRRTTSRPATTSP